MYNKYVDVKGEDTDETNMETNMETAAGSSVDTAAYGACNAGVGIRCRCRRQKRMRSHNPVR